MINLDTEQLKSLLAQLESANSQIDEAMVCLQRVTTHNSWGCAERGTINAHIQENRQQMQRIQRNSESFLNTTRAVADDFCSTENRISSWFDSIDEAIAKVASGNLRLKVQSIKPVWSRIGHRIGASKSGVCAINADPMTCVELDDLDL